MFPWSGSPEERMVHEIDAELGSYRRRLEALDEAFRKKLLVRNEAHTALAEAEERISSLQVEGVTLLGELNAAMSEGDQARIQDLERVYKGNNRDLVRAQKTKEAAARKLETVEVDDEQAVGELKKDASNLLDEYAERIQERKQRLATFMETLDRNQETLARDAAPLTGDYEPRQLDEPPITQDPPPDQ